MVRHVLGVLLFSGSPGSQGKTYCTGFEENIKVSKCVGLANWDPRLGAALGNPSSSHLHLAIGIYIRCYWTNGDDQAVISFVTMS